MFKIKLDKLFQILYQQISHKNLTIMSVLHGSLKRMLKKAEEIPKQTQRTDFFVQSCNELAEQIAQLSVSLKKLKNFDIPAQQINRHFRNSDQLGSDIRFKKVQVPVPILSQEKQVRLEEIEQYIGTVSKQIFQIGFHLLESGQLNNDKTKIFCSQNFISLILKLSTKNSLNSTDMETINNVLIDEILPYFAAKYPLSEEAGANLQFKHLITPVDNILDEENDLLNMTGIKFRYKQSGNYNKQIMLMINNLIDLSRKHKKQFEQQTLDIFKTVQSQQKVQEMLRYDPKSHTSSFGQIDLRTEKNIVKYEVDSYYRDNVRSYTTTQIGMKISSHIQKFTQREIQQEVFDVVDPAILRVLVKWSEELQKYYNMKEIQFRERPFRMRNGSIQYMSHRWMNHVLAGILQLQYKEYPGKLLNEIMKHNYESQCIFSNQKNKFNRLFTVEESQTGFFASKIFKISSFYLKSYINAQIHGIAKALNIFQFIFRYQYSSSPFTQSINAVTQDPSQKNVLTLISKAESHSKGNFITMNTDEYIPQLITFKIGDLLRCRCISKAKQIDALYRLVEKNSFENPKKMKIIRIKNRLDSYSKDVLVNLLLNEQIIVEMQLGMKENQDKFIKASSKFAHYVYELQRSQFGPISQMCSIWASKDPRSTIFQTKFSKQNKRKPQAEKKCQHSGNLIKVNLPFRCSTCTHYYYDIQAQSRHQFCQTCNLYECFLCQIEHLKKEQTKEKQFLKFVFQTQKMLFETGKDKAQIPNQIPDEGQIIISNEKQNKKFDFVRYDDETGNIYLLEIHENNFNLLFSFKKTDSSKIDPDQMKVRKFLLENIIIQTNQKKKMTKSEETDLKQKIRHGFILQRYIHKCEKLLKTSISIVKQKIDCNIFKKYLSGKKTSYCPRILNLSQNKISQFELLIEGFPKIEQLLLQNNLITEIPEKISDAQDLKVLSLKKNQIKTLPASISQLKKLKRLNLMDNQIEDVEETAKICQLTELQYLNMNNNKLKEISDKIGNLKQLKEIWFMRNQLITIPDSVTQLTQLEKFVFVRNSIKKVPQNFGNLVNLKEIGLISNQLKELPASIGNLKKVWRMDCSSNKIERLPQQIVGMTSLLNLSCKYNKLKNLPENIGEMQSLTNLSAEHNEIEAIPENIGKLKNLEEFWIQGNKLTNIPASLCELNKNFRKLVLTNNKIKSLPENIGNITALKELWIDTNELTELPESIGLLQNLTLLDLDNNNVTVFPESIGSLKNLLKLNAISNKLQNLPDSFGNLAKLQILSLSRNSIESLPQSITKLKNLTKCLLSNNKLTALPENLFELVKLQEIYLSGNPIKDFPEKLFQREKITLYISTSQLPAQIVQKIKEKQSNSQWKTMLR